MTPDKPDTVQQLSMLTSCGLRTPHGIFNRRGGVSSVPFDSLNLSYGVGDSVDDVVSNRQQIKKHLGVKILVSAEQNHNDKIYKVDDISEDTEVKGYDALITDRPGVGLLIQQADCQAIMLHDPVQKAIAAVHCGWRGSVLNIIDRTMHRMTDAYRTDPSNVHAVISPSLGPCCAEFTNYQQELPVELHTMQPKPGYFDFWKISSMQLTASGVPANHIETMKICTVCDNSFFSYRRNNRKGTPITGRQGSVILLSL